MLKRIILSILALLTVISLLACHKEKKDMSELFDEAPNQDTQITEQTQNGESNITSNDPVLPSENNSEKEEAKTEEVTEPSKEEEKTEDTTDKSESEKEEDASESTESHPTFKHSEAEIQTIKSRYIEAEDFYYTILNQHFELDSYDVIVRKNSDGYNTEYHRVIYYDVNSLYELKSYYGEYFTDEFVKSLDFDSYAEENGKLYCAQTENAISSSGVKYIYSVESIDESHANIIRTRTDGSSPQKIRCEKIGGIWYFGNVAIS